MEKELAGLNIVGTFSKIECLPEGRKPATAKWVFSHKTNQITDFEARMVARGLSQIPRVDFNHSSSACLSSTTIKTTLAVATEKGVGPFHWDIRQAYIHAKLKEEVYMRLPQGSGVISGKVCKVERALYGRKQSGREWRFEAADALIANGYEQPG